MALKDIKAEDILTSLGIDIAEPEKITLDGVKKQVADSYILRSVAEKDEDLKKKFTGAAFGKIQTKISQLFGLTSAEVDGKPIEDIVTVVKTKYDTQITDLTKKATEGNDEKVTTLTKKVGELESKLSAKEEGIKTLEDKYNKESGEWQGNLKAYKLNDKIAKVKEGLKDKMVDDYNKNELVKTGFEAHLANNYIFDLDDKDEVIVKSKADGKIIMSKEKAGHFASPTEVILMEAEAKQVLKKNKGKETGTKTTVTTQQNNNGDGKSKVHPNAVKAMERFNSAP